MSGYRYTDSGFASNTSKHSIKKAISIINELDESKCGRIIARVRFAEVAHEGVFTCARNCLKSTFQLHTSLNYVYM